MNQSTKPTREDYLQSIIFIIIYLLVIGAGAFILIPTYWYLWLLLVIGGLILLVNWHKESTAYRCPECDHEYTISFLADLTAPHGIDRGGGWLLLRCPNCKERRKTRVLKRMKE